MLEALEEVSKQIVEDNAVDYTQSLIKYHENSTLDEFDNNEIEIQFKSLLEKSVLYCFMSRCELDTSLIFTADDFYNIHLFNTSETVGLLGNASRDITEMGLSEIGKLVRELSLNKIHTFVKAEEKIENTDIDERSIQNEQRDNIQSSGRLSNAKLENGRTNDTWQVRNVEKDLSKKQSSGSILQIENDQQIKRTLADDRGTSANENGNADKSIAVDTSSTEQRKEPNGLGTTHEQFKESSRGYYSQGDSLQLNLNLGGAEVDVEPELPPFDLHDLPQLLREDIELQHSKEDIIKYFHEHTKDEERAQYLDSCYNQTLVEIFRNSAIQDYTHIGYKKNDEEFNRKIGLTTGKGNGLRVWLGGYMNPQTESFLSFQYLQSVVADLIDKDEYLMDPISKKSDIQLEYERKVVNYATERAILTNHDFINSSTPEVIQFFKENHTKEEQCDFVKRLYNDTPIDFSKDGMNIGYVKQENGLLFYYGTKMNKEQEQLYEWERIVGFIDGLVLTRYYDPKVQIPSIEEQKTAIYKSVEEFNKNHYFSQEEINRILVRGSGISNGKFRIYQQFQKHDTLENNTLFLKHEYGTGGVYPALNGSQVDERHDAKGITLSKGNITNPEVKIVMKWKDVAKNIQNLVSLDHYLNSEEKKAYLSYLQNQIENELNNERKEVNGKIVSPTHKDYIYKIGDTFYKGIDEYEILEIEKNFINIQNKMFPLFTETISKVEMLSILKENPLNDKLVSGVEDELPILNTNQLSREESENETIYNLLYKQFEKFAEHITSNRSCLITLMAGEHDDPLSISNFDDEPNLVTMLHYYEEYGIERNSPFMKFTIDREKKEIVPIYYEHDYPYLELSLDKENAFFSIDEAHAELDNYAKTWFQNIMDKQYLISYEQYYENETHNKVYDIDINKERIITHTNLPYEKIPAYCKEMNVTLLKEFQISDELNTIEDILTKLYIEDIQLYWDDKKNEIKAHDSMGNKWHGKSFHDFMLNETIVYESDGTSAVISDELLNHYKEIASKYSSFIKEDSIPPIQPKLDYHINDNQLGVGTPKIRYANNVVAIRLLFSLEKANRLATTKEQEVLAQYVGWGGLADVFDETNNSWSNEYQELKNLLSEEEYRSARESTLSAFYTSPIVIKSIYQAIENMGFQYGNILEPACGTGNFFGAIPETLQSSKMYGIELDSISGRIAKQLYQNANIGIAGYENTNLPDSFFDVAVGNVPFGQFKVRDKKYDKYNFSIHDYFFAKTIDKVRPNGVIAFITSRYTMDKANSSIRKYINERTEFLGAIRLPNNAFKDSAGTKAVSDIIFLQKRERPLIGDSEWLYTEKSLDELGMNSYFINNPDMVLGNVEKTKAMHGRDDLTVTPFEDVTLEESLNDAIVNIHAQIDERTFDDLIEEDNESISIPADPTVRNFSYTLVNGNIYFRENSVMNKVELSETARNRIVGMIGIRECTRELILYQSEDYPAEQIKTKQLELDTLYDVFTSKYGLINSRANAVAFRDDSSYYLLCSLENLNEDGTLKSKADIFTKRTIRKEKDITHTDTSAEALIVSLTNMAKVDIPYMSKLTGFNKNKIIQDLQGMIFKLPNVLDENAQDVYVTSDEYLSGNIRDKLDIAKMSATIDPQYQEHVEALKKAIPKDLSASEIEVRIGATWVPIKLYKQFMFEILSTSNFNQSYIDISYSEYTNTWNIKNKSFDNNNIKANKTYGTSRVNAYKLIEDCLNLKATKIYDYEYDDDGKKISVLNKRETMIAQQKQDSIKDAFKEWIWKEHDRRDEVVKIYNKTFNSIRPREYDGEHLTFPNMNPEISLRKHQKDAIAHMLYGHNVLLAHVVGAGKTYEMTAACMEMKRIGTIQKAMFVVPNHLVEQWGAEFLQLYPTSNVLVTTKRDFEKSRRKRFVSRIATGEYDAIIIGHSQFEKIPMSVERQKETILKEIESVTMGLSDLKHNNGPRFSIKQMEKTKKSLQNRLEKLNDDNRKDDLITFEELGIDYLFVDEAHFYKNLFLFTKMNNVAGISSTEAQKSSDMFMKCQYLNEITNGKGITFATGTPISNSMTEMYTMQRYLQYNTLVKHNLQFFDSWASTFGETVSAVELSPEGSGYRMKTRFAKFYNLPELMSMFKEVADIKTADMLSLPTPTPHYHNVSVKPSELQKEVVESLAERAQLIRDGGVDPTEDNMLKITNDGRKVALDQRLINPSLPEFEDSKVNACIRNVFETWEMNKDKKSTQLVFCDMSTPNNKSFNVYDEIKTKLIELGIPEDEIAYVHNANSDFKKKELFSKVRSGKTRVLLGSTQKMGAGTNVQDKLIAIHDLDCPWRPSDLEQRSGRIIRQGNINSDVHIYRYVTEGTFDAYLYQLVENKQKFIGQIMSSKTPLRSADDIDESALSYAEIKALASGNPKVKEKMDLDIEVNKLKLAKANYLSQKYELEDKIIKYYPNKIKLIEQRVAGLEEDIKLIHPTNEFSSMTLFDKVYSEKEEAGNAILLACKQCTSTEPIHLGKYRGFDMNIEYDSFHNIHTVKLIGTLTYPVDLGNDVYGNITRLDNQIDSLEKKLQIEKELLNENQQQLEYAKEEVQKPFVKEAELKEKSERLSLLNNELDLNAKNDSDLFIEIPQDEKKKVVDRER